jgi:PAS domain S-box-containing protein
MTVFGWDRLRLRYLVPASVLLVFLLATVFSLYYTIQKREAAFVEATVDRYQAQLADIVRASELLETADHALLVEAFNRISSGHDVEFALLVNGDDRIAQATVPRWTGSTMANTVSAELTDIASTAKRTRAMTVNASDGNHLVLAMSYSANIGMNLRNLNRGVVVLVLDFEKSLILVRREAVLERLPDLGVWLFGALLLMRFLDKWITRPLDALRTEMTQPHSGSLPVIPLQGASEVRALTESLRTMRERIDEQMRSLSEQIALNQAILDNTVDGVFSVNGDSVISGVFNPSASRIFGYPPGEFLGKSLADVLPSETFDIANVEFGVVHEGVGRSIDGAAVPIELACASLTLEGEQKFILVVRDISVRKRTEQQLLEARIEAERANQAKSEFLASMSHELRTPLNTILGYCQLLTEDCSVPHELRTRIAEIERASQHLLALVSDIIDLSRIEAGKLALKYEVFPLLEVIEESRAIVAVYAGDRGTRIESHSTEPAPIYVNADRIRVRQVMINLLTNAVKYGPRDSVVSVELKLVAPEGVRVEVRDHGPGVPAELRSRLFFDAFDRLGRELGEVEGAGIGLVICHRLLAAMGGVIGVDEALDGGAVFWFELACCAHSTTRTISGSAGEHAFEGSPVLASQIRDLKGKKVLLAEDNPINQRMMQLILEREGCELSLAQNGQDAVDQYQQGRFDLVLMDCAMPVMDGYQATRRIREYEVLAQLPRIPIIAVTANALEGDYERVKAAGMDDYLTKPIRLPDLRELLSRWST